MIWILIKNPYQTQQNWDQDLYACDLAIIRVSTEWNCRTINFESLPWHTVAK